MIYTYTTFEKAKEAIPEFCKQKEQDCFICFVEYPCGEEYQLRTRNDIFSEDSKKVIHKYYLPIDHEFTERDNALRELEIWKARLGKDIELERHCKREKGYPVFTHYSLNVLSHV